MSSQSQPETGAEETLTQALDKLFAPWNRSDAPGFAVGIAKNGVPLYRRGFGLASIESRVANAPTTRMRIGSTTKHFTCLLVALLAEEGKLDLDDDIRSYVPELPALEAKRTLRQLMTHTSGMRCYLDLAMIENGLRAVQNEENLEYMTRQKVANFAPGERFMYCNGGYFVLSLAVERITGQSFETVLEERLLRPLGMRDTLNLRSDMDLLPGMATLHFALPGGVFRRGLFPASILGEGGIVSTVDDMLLWLAHLRAPRIGSEATWKAMLTPATYNNGHQGSYALGLFREIYRGVETIHHAGGVIGGCSQMLTVPAHGLDVVILANRSDFMPTDLAYRVVDAVLASHLREVQAPVREVAHLTGSFYSDESQALLEFVETEGALHLNFSGLHIPVIRRDEARLGFDFPTLNEIEIHVPAGKSAPDALQITSSGRTQNFRRVDPASARIDAAALAGTYRSDEIRANAVIGSDADGIFLTMQGRYGEAQYRLAPLDGGVLHATTKDLRAAQPSFIVTLDRKNDVITGFRLTTGRTVELEFARI